MANIKFGTDGWRAIIDEDFTFENVEIVTLAIAKYVFENFGIEKKIIIGYDPRINGLEYAKFCAKILADKGFLVQISDNILPTPVLAFFAQLENACAIMFTASHNPANYSGIKFIPDYAGPATDKITQEIVKNLEKNFSTGTAAKNYEFKTFKKEYFEHLQKIINFPKIKSANLNIIFDALHSSAIGYFDEILNNNQINFQALRTNFDPNFGGELPEPKPKHLKSLISLIKETHEQGKDALGLSNDGDADRFGVINELGEYVSPNEIIAILLKHLVINKKISGKLVKTVGASLMLDEIAKKYNTQVIETPVGFKWVGEAMREHDILIGGEESGGLSIKGHIPEKDGILANLLILEALAYFQKPLYLLQLELKQEIGINFVTGRLDFKLNSSGEKNALIKKFVDTEFFMNIKKIDKKDGVKIYFDDDRSWILIRESGTEPLIRVYFESDSQEKLTKLQKLFSI